jgi:hypothetical protein
MVELQKILPVTKVKRELLDILKAMEERIYYDYGYQKWKACRRYDDS